MSYGFNRFTNSYCSLSRTGWRTTRKVWPSYSLKYIKQTNPGTSFNRSRHKFKICKHKLGQPLSINHSAIQPRERFSARRLIPVSLPESFEEKHDPLSRVSACQKMVKFSFNLPTTKSALQLQSFKSQMISAASLLREKDCVSRANKDNAL